MRNLEERWCNIFDKALRFYTNNPMKLPVHLPLI